MSGQVIFSTINKEQAVLSDTRYKGENSSTTFFTFFTFIPFIFFTLVFCLLIFLFPLIYMLSS